VLLVGFVGLSHAALASAPVQEMVHLPLLQRLRGTGIGLAPYVMVTAFFTALYMMIPNTRVQWRAALIGALVGGVLWAAVGKMFTAFVVYSTRLTMVYAGFAFVVAALLWTYFGWLILLAGAQLSFYVQNPTYLRLGLQQLRLSSVELEQLALKLMYFVGRTHVAGGWRWSVNRLATELGLPGIAVAQMAATLERAGLLIVTDYDELVPARDIGGISVYEILDIARNYGSGHVAPRNLPIPRSTGCWPVSRTRAAIAAASSRYATWSMRLRGRRCSSLPGNRHLAEQHRAGADTAAHVTIVAERHDVPVHGPQIAGDGDLVHRIRDGAALHPEAARAARVVPGHPVHALPHQLGHQEPRVQAVEEPGCIQRSLGAGHDEVVNAAGVAGGGQPQTPRGVAAEHVATHHPVAHQLAIARGGAFLSNGLLARPLRMCGRSCICRNAGKICSPAAFSRNEDLRYWLVPLIAPTKCLNRPRATSGEKATGTLRVVRRRAPSRATARTPAVRPTLATPSSSVGSRAMVNQ